MACSSVLTMGATYHMRAGRVPRFGAGGGNRTLVCSLGSCRSAIELRPRSLEPPDLAETGPSAKRFGTYPPLPHSALTGVNSPDAAVCGGAMMPGQGAAHDTARLHDF